MHLSTATTVAFALAIAPTFSAPIPAFSATIPNSPECEVDAVSFLGPRSQSIFSIRSYCAEVRKRSEKLSKRAVSAVSPMHLVPVPLSSDANLDKSDDVAAADLPKFELVSPPTSSSFILDAEFSGKEELIDSSIAHSKSKSANMDIDFAAHAAEGNWRRVEYERHTILLAVARRGENPVFVGAMAMLLIATVLLMIRAILSVSRRVFGGKSKRRQRRPSFIRIPSPTSGGEKKDDDDSAGMFNEWMIFDP